MKLSPRTFILPGLAGIAGIATWYAIHFALSDDMRFVLPTPNAILEAVRDNGATLAHAAFNTSAGALAGFAAATALSAVLAMMMSFSTSLRTSIYPYLMILQMTPVVVIAPILVLWINSGFVRVVVITVLVCFFPIAVNTTQGLISTDRNLVDLFRMWRASRWQQLVHLRIPAALPYFFAGLRIAAVLAPIAALVGDYTAGSSGGDGGGLGFQAIVYSSQAQYPALFATAAVTCILGFVLTGGVIYVSWLTLHRWHDAYETRR